MIPTTRFLDYNPTENLRMAEVVKDFFEIFEEVSTKLKDVHDKKLKLVADETRPNDIHINPSIQAEYFKLEKAEMPIHLIIPKYEEWFDELYRLTIVNEPWLAHKQVFRHLAEIMAVCATFEQILTKAREGLPEI